MAKKGQLHESADFADRKNQIFEKIQGYLKPAPVIIWGSGATIPYGLPSVDDLKRHLNIESQENLERHLSRIRGKNKLECYKRKIFEIVSNSDKEFRENFRRNPVISDPVKNILNYFYDAQNSKVSIITTNYDCVLEHMLSFHGLPFSDGFSGREFSKFQEDSLTNAGKKIRLIKVHGSIRWLEMMYTNDNSSMDAIIPAQSKYKESLQDPFRTLIAMSDKAITKSENFLSIGFGFGDDHLTPYIERGIKGNSRIVVIARHATDGIKQKILKKAKKFILIEACDCENDKTNISYRENDELCSFCLPGKYWELKEFQNILIGKHHE